MPPYSGGDRGQALPLADRRGRGLRAAEAGRAQGAEGAEDRAVLRLPDPAAVEDPRLRGSRPPVVARADHQRLRRRAGRLPGEDQVLRLPDHPGARGDRARRADPADRAGDGGRAPTRWSRPARSATCRSTRGSRSSRRRPAGRSACRSSTSRSSSASPPGFSESELKFKRHVVPVDAGRREARGLTRGARSHGLGRGRRGRDGRHRLGAVRGRLGAARASCEVAAARAAARARRAADRAPLRLPPRRPVAGDRGRSSARSSGWPSGSPTSCCSPATCSRGPKGRSGCAS